MYKKFFILVFCLFLLGGCIAAKHKKTNSDEEWRRSNTMSREHGERHAQVRPGGLINIDDTHEADVIEGSALGKRDDDVDSHSGNGAGVDDEDDDGSATGPDTRTECQKLRDQLNRRMLLGAYVPECSVSGDFKPVQCSGSKQYCWCVDFKGREIDGTKKKAPHKPDCSQIDTPVVNKAVLPPVDHDETINVIEKQHIDKDRSAQNPGYTVPTENSNTDIGTTVDPILSNMVPGADGAKEEPAEDDQGSMFKSTQDEEKDSVAAIMGHPGILAGIIGGAVVGLLCAILLVMFIVYRMRKKDEGSYALDEPKRSPPINSYSRSTNREFYA